MTITRIAIFSGLLLGGLIAGLFLRSGSSDPDSPKPAPTSQPSESRPTTPEAAKQSLPVPASPKRRGPAIDEATAMSMDVHPIENPTCPVMGNPTTADSFSILYNGLLVRFCCPGCDDEFLAEPVRHLTAMKKEGAKVPTKALSDDANPKVVMAENETCPVTGKAIADSKLYVVQDGHKIRVCCPMCIASIAKDPGLTSSLIRRADTAEHTIRHQTKERGMPAAAAVEIENPTCPIMGKPTDEDSFAITYNGMRVRFCCPGCDGKFLERPRSLLAAMKREGAKVPDSALTEAANPEVINLENAICPVMGDEVSDSEFYVVHRGLKVGLCCESCVNKFDAKAEGILATLAKTDPRVAARVGR